MQKPDKQNETMEEKVPKLVEGVDFYFEDGLMVLTAEFLRKRGYCCGSGCRHCPYPKDESSEEN